LNTEPEIATLKSTRKIENKAQFEELFNSNYSNLCAYANNFLKDVPASEEVVQEVLFKLWVNRDSIEVKTSFQSYLFRAVRNGCLNVLKHVDIRDNYKKHNERTIKQKEFNVDDNIIATELEQKIREAVDKLPLERRKIFVMSRYDELSYKEIAGKLNISVKTVENQIGRALKTLRDELSDYLPWITLFFYEFFKSQ
jgi:RNA polymerase sigma-70 factor (ECF subfamily)